jgi:hypothetical protein
MKILKISRVCSLSPDKLKNKLISKVKEKTPAAALRKSNYCA